MTKLQGLIRSWYSRLVLLGVSLAALNAYAFYPGFMSNDSIDQLMQVLGMKPFEDWHPPVMAAWWWLLVKLSGHSLGMLLVWQVTLLWVALLLLSAYIYKVTCNKVLSLVPLALGLMPFVVNISGVLWKDVEMAYALLMACVLLLLVKENLRRKVSRNAALGVAVLLMIYAVNLRYNAILAMLPLGWLILESGISRKVGYALLTLFVAGLFLANPLINLMKPIRGTNPASNTMVDDIINVYPESALMGLSTPEPVRKALSDLHENCDVQKRRVSVMIGCATEVDRKILSESHYKDVEKLWMHGIMQHPFSYATYRLHAFLIFLHPEDPARAYIWQDGIEPGNPLHIVSKANTLSRWTKNYVQFAALDFGFLFRPYVWLVAGTLLVVFLRREQKTYRHARFCTILAVSGVLYIVSYIPLVAAEDYRYVYWSVIAISASAILVLIDAYGTTDQVMPYAVNGRRGKPVRRQAKTGPA